MKITNSTQSNIQGKNILISGAAGFVPSHVCEFYLQRGANVFGFDNFITGSKANVEVLAKYENFKFLEQDLILGLPDFGEVNFDYIFSLASPASPIDFKVIPLEIMRVNSEGTLRLLELAKAHKARILVASTSEVYGDPEVHPQHEGYVGHVNTLGPRAPYDEAKRYSEAMTMTFNRKFGVETRLIRIFNTYGPRMRANDGRVIPNFINQALQNEDITIYGDGSQTRSFCFCDDLVRAMDIVMHSDDPTPFNIGNPDEYSVLECGEAIINALSSKSKLTFMELPKDDPKKRKPDLSKIQSISDYAPQVTFDEGIAKTAEFFKSL